MRIRRTFTEDFKRQISEAIISRQVSQLELSRKYGISSVIISRWGKEYYAGKFFENSNPDYTRLQIKVKELRRLVGELTLKNKTLEEIIKLVEPPKKASQQIFTSVDWEILKRVQTSEHTKIKLFLWNQIASVYCRFRRMRQSDILLDR